MAGKQTTNDNGQSGLDIRTKAKKTASGCVAPEAAMEVLLIPNCNYHFDRYVNGLVRVCA